jgi:phosphodiesterase/alkaline phosphatase D-like protein
MIWDDKQHKEKDDWETYAHERQALFDFIRRERIGGVVLFGGDVHVSRVLKYPAEAAVGYPLYQFISSPIHDHVLAELNVPHPNLLHAAETPHTFLKITADTTKDPALLTAEFIDRDGQRLFDAIEIRADQLAP